MNQQHLEKAETKILRENIVSKASPMEIKENSVRITGTVMGVADRTGDVIFPGALSKSVLKLWEQEGWLDVSHSWDGKAAGMPVKAWIETDANGYETLRLECEFHSTQDAQEARTLTMERLAKGKKVSTSIGFMPDYGDNVLWFETGQKLLDFAEEKGYDLTKFDVKNIKKLGWCRAIVAIRELFEISLCNVGMHRGARADQAKSGVNRKSKTTTVSAILQAKIHQSFTVAADELAIRGYMDTQERIALSGAIGESLRLFASLIDSTVGDREIDPLDVDWVASKDFSGSHGAPLLDELRAALGAVHRTLELMELRKAEGGSLGKESLAIVSEINAKTSKIIGSSSAEKPTEKTTDLSSQITDLELFLLEI